MKSKGLATNPSPPASVNSVHHQGIGEVAPAFRVTAATGDGIIEAFEPRDEAWPMWAIQWHPEWLPDQEPSLRLFRAVVDAAS